MQIKEGRAQLCSCEGNEQEMCCVLLFVRKHEAGSVFIWRAEMHRETDCPQHARDRVSSLSRVDTTRNQVI